MGQTQRALKMSAAFVRTAMPQQVQHPVQKPGFHELAVAPEDPSNSAHASIPKAPS